MRTENQKKTIYRVVSEMCLVRNVCVRRSPQPPSWQRIPGEAKKAEMVEPQVKVTYIEDLWRSSLVFQNSFDSHGLKLGQLVDTILEVGKKAQHHIALSDGINALPLRIAA